MKLGNNQIIKVILIGGITYSTITGVFLYGSIQLSKDPDGFMQDPLVLFHLVISGLILIAFFSISSENLNLSSKKLLASLLSFECVGILYILYAFFLYDGIFENILKRNSFPFLFTMTLVLLKFLWIKFKKADIMTS